MSHESRNEKFVKSIIIIVMIFKSSLLKLNDIFLFIQIKIRNLSNRNQWNKTKIRFNFFINNNKYLHCDLKLQSIKPVQNDHKFIKLFYLLKNHINFMTIMLIFIVYFLILFIYDLFNFLFLIQFFI